ncbi:hypothetical protein EMPG_15004 [Blastomyces silverae]|uniref:Uncharacterized protein n=1 Tax=Blastomyces silverae TaxID=2060906 RepID=A0A0H1BK63_9EURO|nr:hypothetical protein EMPG_15004 [Blastomyces silverae]
MSAPTQPMSLAALKHPPQLRITNFLNFSKSRQSRLNRDMEILNSSASAALHPIPDLVSFSAVFMCQQVASGAQQQLLGF